MPTAMPVPVAPINCGDKTTLVMVQPPPEQEPPVVPDREMEFIPESLLDIEPPDSVSVLLFGPYVDHVAGVIYETLA
jgi:hypothetical protein